VTTFIDFINLTYSIRDKDLLADFLYGVTTVKERRELTRRIDIIEQLLADIPQHKIASDLNVGVATVTRGSKELSEGRFKVLRK